MDKQAMPDRIRECARMACEPARTELRKIADELERQQVTQHQKNEERNG